MLRESTDMAMDVEFQLSKAESLSALRLYYIQFLRRRDGDATMRAKAIVGLQQIFAYRQPEGDVAEGALEDIRQIVSTALHEQTPAMTLVAIRALIPMLHQVKTMTDSLHRTATCLAELANGAVNEAFRE
ncbi:MAG: hypothetical protein JNL79_21355, partial [Myxococcales bacterium]|nr:hypothetical protein [Myxococcales bacterium]